MPSLESTLEDLVIGDDYDIERNIMGIPYGATLTVAWLTIKQDVDDTDAQAIVQKVITIVPMGGIGQITDESATDLVGAVLFQLTNADTLLLNRNTTYSYDIQVKTSTNKIFTVERGYFTPVSQLTVSTA